jgi:hypothetical protein
MRIYAVTVPIAGHAYMIVEAENEHEAKEKALAECSIDLVENWEPLEQFNQGNVCYCPQPWEIEVVDETPDDEPTP